MNVTSHTAYGAVFAFDGLNMPVASHLSVSTDSNKFEQMRIRVLYAKTIAMDLKPVKIKPVAGSMCILGTLADSSMADILIVAVMLCSISAVQFHDDANHPP